MEAPADDATTTRPLDKHYLLQYVSWPPSNKFVNLTNDVREDDENEAPVYDATTTRPLDKHYLMRYVPWPPSNEIVNLANELVG